MKTHKLIPKALAPRVHALAATLLSLLLLPVLSLPTRAQLSLNTGTLVITSTDDLALLGGMPISNNFVFTGNAADSGTLVIAAGSDIVFDSDGGADNRLTLAAGSYGNFYLDSGATLTFSGNTTASSGNGAAIALAAGSRLILATAAGSSYIFRNNYTAGNGGAIYANGASTFLQITNALFQSNTANQGGAIYVTGAPSVYLEVTDALFQSNTAATGGAFFINNGTAIINSSTFLNNRSTGNTNNINGGALYSTASTSYIELNDVSFICNLAAGAATRGGAIGIYNPAVNFALNYNVTSGTSFIAGNTSGSSGASSGITVINNNLFTVNINLFTAAGSVLEMLDPFYLSGVNNNSANVVIMEKTGAGTLNLAGDNTLNKASNTGSYDFIISEGTLHLYRGGEQIFVPGAGVFTAAKANILMVGTQANNSMSFNLGAGAKLSIGGGNTFSSSAPTQNAGQSITFSPGSILSFDLLDTSAAGLGLISSSPLLTLTAPGTNIKYNIASSGTFNFSLDFSTWASGSYNLLYANAGAVITLTNFLTTGTLIDTNWQSALLSSISYGSAITPFYDPTFSIDALGYLWITFVENPILLASTLASWDGLASSDWHGANWRTITPSAIGLSVPQGQIVNFDGLAAGSLTTDIGATTTATVSAMYVSGTQSYIIKGAGITADTTSGTYATETANTGKLVLGALAIDTGADIALTYTTFTGTLDLTQTGTNTFTNGIEIHTGALLVATNDQLGIPTLGKLSFTGSGALLVNGDLAFSGGLAAANRLSIAAGVSATISLAPDATFSFTDNVSSSAGGFAALTATGARLDLVSGSGASFIFTSNTTTANNGGLINLAASTTLNLLGIDGGGFLFQSNTSVGQGGIINANASSAALFVTSATFEGNSSSGGGGAIGGTGASIRITVEDSLFQSNTAVGTGGALFTNQATAVTTIRSSTFDSNYARGNGGGALSIQAGGAIYVYDSTFINNTVTAVGGGAIHAIGTGVNRLFQNTLFISNTALAGGGGAFYTTGAFGAVTFTDTSFLDNTAAAGNGGAILIDQIQLNPNIYINVTANNTSRFAGNTASGTANSIFWNITTSSANNTGTLSIHTGSNATLDMIDPMGGTLTAAAGYGLQITKTGSYGTWNLGGDNNFTKLGSNATNKFTLTVAEGTLHLYRGGEQVTDPNTGKTYTASAANFNVLGINNLNSEFIFTVKAGATLSIGGGNKFTYDKGAYLSNNSTITFEAGSFLTFDLAHYTDIAGASSTPGAGTALLSLGLPTLANYNILTGNALNPFLNINYDTLVNGTYNLLSITPGAFDNLTDFTSILENATYADLTYLQFLNAGYTASLGVTNNTLWITLGGGASLSNNVLTWTGASGASWLAANNWITLGSPATYTKGDIINLADNTSTPLISAPAATTIDVDATGGATISGLHLSGTTNYTITGSSITASSTASLSFDPATDLAATGKLILGALASDDASTLATADTDPAVAYQGTLTLANTSNTFTSGIDIFSGHLVGNAATLGVGAGGTTSVSSAASLTFDQATDATYPTPIAGSGLLIKTNTATLTLAANNTSFTGQTTIAAGTLLLAQSARLGGNITVQPAATLAAANTSAALGNVTLSNNSTLQIGLGSTGFQSILIGGDLILGTLATDTSLLNFTNLTNTLTINGAILQTGSTTLNVNATTSGTYNLINVLGSSGLTTTNFDLSLLSITFNNTFLDPAAYSLGITDNWLSLIFHERINKILTWTAAENRSWNTTSNNWITNETTPLPTPFFQGDIVNLTAAAAGSINIATPVTLGAIYISGNADYTFTGSSVVANPAASSLLGIANSGKLILGRIATAPAVIDDAPFTASLTLANSANTFLGGIDILSGTLVVNNAATLDTGDAGIYINADASLTFNQSTAATFSAILSGAGSITKTGPAALALTGNSNAFTGLLTTTSGALLLQGPYAALGGSVTILSTATLAGNGAIAGNLSIRTDASLAPDGILSISNTLALDNNSTLRFSTSPGDAAPLRIGTLSLDGATIINLSSPVSGTYNLITAITPLAPADTTSLLTTINNAPLSARTTASYSLLNSGRDLALTLDITNIALTWVGSPSATWDTTSTNWSAPLDNKYAAGDFLTFDDTVATAAARSITLNSTVSTAGILVSTTGIYSLSGSGNIITSTLNTTLTVDADSITGKLTKAGSGTLSLTGLAQTSGVNLAQGDPNTFTNGIDILDGTVIGSVNNLRIGTSATLTLASPSATINFAVPTDADETFTSPITGPGNLVKSDTGALTLSGITDYTGATTILRGSLSLTRVNQLASSSSITITAGSLDTGERNQILHNLSGAGGIDAGIGSLSLINDPDSTHLYSGAITTSSTLSISNGLLILTGNNTINGLVTIAASTTLQLGNGGTTGSLGPANILNNSSLILNHSAAVTAAASAINGAISGTGLITKLPADTGILTLSGNSSSFTGTTLIQGGALALNNASLGGDTFLSNNTSLSGAGSLASLTTLGSSTITIGLNHGVATSPQILNITGALTLSPNTTLRFDIYKSGSSDLLTAGSITRAGSDTIDISINSTYSGTYTLITAPGVSDLNIATLNNGGTLSARSTATYDIENDSLILTLLTTNTTLVWNGTNGTIWQGNISNWQSDDGKFLDGDSVIFDDTRSGTNTVNVAANGVTAAGIVISTTSSYTFNGGPIITSTAASSLADAGDKLILDSANTGRVTLNNTATNTFTGGIEILSGTLQGSAASLTVGPGASILNNGALIFSQTSSGTYTAPITGTGSLSKTGTAALILAAPAAYTDGLTVTQGSLTLTDSTAHGTQGDITIAAGATLNITNAPSYTIQNTISNAGALSISLSDPAAAVTFATAPTAFTGTLILGPSTFDLSGDNTSALTNATLHLNAGNTTRVGSGTQTIAALSINGGRIDFTAGSMQVASLTLGSSGTIQAYIPLPVDLTSNTSLFAQASGTNLARLLTATTVSGTINSFVLVDQNNTPVTAASSSASAIIQNGYTVATGTYSYSLNATGGINIKYSLASLSILSGQTLLLAPATGETGLFEATIAGSGHLDIDASNAPVTLNKSNTSYTGATTLLSGTLIAAAANALGSSTASLTQLANTTLNTGTFPQTIATLVTAPSATTIIPASGTAAIGSLTLTNGGAINGALTGSGTLRLTGGALEITAANPSYSGPAAIAAASVLSLADFQALGTGVISNAGTLNLNTTTSGSFTNPLTGAGVLNLNGAATTFLVTSNTAFSGPVNINGPVAATTTGALGTGPVTINADLTYSARGPLANTLSGAGTLNFSSTTSVTGNNIHFTGAINALPGSQVTLSSSPNALHSTSLNINAASVILNLNNADNNLNNASLGNVTLSNGATLAFASGTQAKPAGSLATLASLNGSGTLHFNTNVGPFGSADTLVINGPANGAFAITLTNSGTAGPFTGVATRPLVDAKSGGDAQYSGAGSFNNLGMYLYDWSVKSLNGSATLHVAQSASFSPIGGAILANAIGTLPLTWFAELDTLHNRLGDLHLAPRAKPGVDLWLRAYSQRLNVNDKNTPVPFNETQYGTEVGADYGGLNNFTGFSTYLGAYAGYGASSRDLSDSNVNGDTTSIHAGAYATLVSPAGWYIDLVAKYNHFKNTFTANYDPSQSMSASYTTTVFGGSIEFGKRVNLGRRWHLTPSAQAAMARIEAANYDTDALQPQLRLAIAQQSAVSRQLRAGLLLSRQYLSKNDQIIQPYAKFNLARQWSTGGAILVSSRDTGAPDANGPYHFIIEGNRLEAGLGLNWLLRKNLQLYLDYTTAWARDYQKPYGFTLGINYAW